MSEKSRAYERIGVVIVLLFMFQMIYSWCQKASQAIGTLSKMISNDQGTLSKRISDD